jgi:hypothetical protein
VRYPSKYVRSASPYASGAISFSTPPLPFSSCAGGGRRILKRSWRRLLTSNQTLRLLALILQLVPVTANAAYDAGALASNRIIVSQA